MEQEKKFSERLQVIAYKNTLSFKEALMYLDVKESTLYKLTSNNEIPFSKPNGGKLYFKKADLEKWMNQNPILSISQLERKALAS